MNAVLERSITEEAYSDTKDWIYKIVWGFYKKYYGAYNEEKFNELLADANVLFVEACHDTGSWLLTSQIYYWVYNGLVDLRLRRRPQSVSAVNNVEVIGSHIPCKESNFDLQELIGQLSQDGKDVVNLLCLPPEEVYQQALTKGGSPRNISKSVKDHLLNKLGWTQRRIKESFEEIKYLIREGY